MTQPAAQPSHETPAAKRSRIPAWIRHPIRWAWVALKILVQALLIGWASLAIYYSNLPWPMGRLVLAVAFSAMAIAAIWVVRRPKWRWAFVVGFVAVVIWHIRIQPSNDRPWRAEVARPPRAIINGDHVRFIDFRDFRFRTRNDFDVRYKERDVDISRLVSVDLLVSYWAEGLVAHTFVSFNLDDGSPPVCISIETRPEVGEGFDPLASMFKQFELIYIVGEERDIVRTRTDDREEQVYLYRIMTTPDRVQALFRIYLDRINKLADHPEWYHLLSNSCTINVIRYSRAVGGPHRRFELKHFLNGLIDAYLYRLGIIDTSLPFDELRKRSNITEAAREAGDVDDFSTRIRRGLPGIDDQP